MKSPQRHGALRRPAVHVDGARSPQTAQGYERSPPRASPERTGSPESTPAPPVSKPVPRKSLGPVAWHAEMRRLLDELDNDGVKSQAAMPPPLAAGSTCEPVLSNDVGKGVLEELQGMLSELQEGQARLQAVHGKTKIMQVQVTEYVEQRLREHSELWENRIAQEVRQQVGGLAVALQKQERHVEGYAMPSASLASQAEKMQRMNGCSSQSGTLPAIPQTNAVASEQHEDHLEQDGFRQQLVAIEQRLEAAVATAELAVPSLLDLSRCEASVSALLSTRSSGNASQVRNLLPGSPVFPQHHTSPEPNTATAAEATAAAAEDGLPVAPWSEGDEQHHKSGTTSPRLVAHGTSPRWQLHRKASGTQSLADILEYRRRTCEGLPPPPSKVLPDSLGYGE
mmetsp:Transcript_81738/g.157870  ORF Transcript_81738/g.157870 Transcript_81738/m.157870 type:complete len:396 (-) Transcript_81738:31-1218(-)